MALNTLLVDSGKISRKLTPILMWSNGQFGLLWLHAVISKLETTFRAFGMLFQKVRSLYSKRIKRSIKNYFAEESLNGAVEAATTLCGAITVFLVSFITLDWKVWGNVTIIIVNGISALSLYLMGVIDEIWVAYIGYLVFRMSYQVLMTIASYEIVKQLPEDAYGLIFGINTFIGLCYQTVLTIVVNTVLGIDPKPQFIIYGAYHLVICIGYAILQIASKNCICGPNKS